MDGRNCRDKHVLARGFKWAKRRLLFPMAAISMVSCPVHLFINTFHSNDMRIIFTLLLLFLLVVFTPIFEILSFDAFGQETSAKPFYAPGGLIVIPTDIDYDLVFNRADIPEVLAKLPEVDPDLKEDPRFQKEIWAQDVRYGRDVWCLQFSFKPLRIIDVDIPNTEGNFDRKKVWYLVYNVKNWGPADLAEKKINSSLGSDVPAGSELNLPVPAEKTTLQVPRSAPWEPRQQRGIFEPSPGSDEPISFVPHFVLATHRLVLGTVPVDHSDLDHADPENSNPENSNVETTEWKTISKPVAYNDRMIPLALPKIASREGMKTLPETTVSIPLKKMASGEDLWGVAMWTDVDPRINEFSIFVGGLTNAYQWTDKKTADGTYENTGKIREGRILKRRVLKLDWWRVGDPGSLHEGQFHFGSKDLDVRKSPLDEQAGRMPPEKRKNIEEIKKAADADRDGWVSPAEKAVYHLMQQDWLKPRLEYEWVFL